MARRCAICNSGKLQTVYRGPIRDGVAGSEVTAAIWRCSSCGVEFLPSDAPLDYRTTSYREHVGQKTAPDDYLRRHDPEQLARYPLLADIPLRGAVVADIGCAAGSFLDGIKGLASVTLAVEPARFYHASLKQRGHRIFPDVTTALRSWKGRVDLAVCFSVLEHLEDPVGLMKDIRRLLKPSGHALLSTPNRRDILLQAGVEAYRRFYYRRAHLFYFDESSLRTAAERAGFSTFEARYVHRFKFANFMNWLRQGRPSGDTAASPLGPAFDNLWKAFLEEQGGADYLYAFLGR